jgi:ubiquinone/menaquinone biosynthesis C-methylase UbiE
MNEKLSKQIKHENKRIHAIEANFYDKVHPEIWNFYEQKKTDKEINSICDVINKKSKNPLALDVGCGTGNLTLKFLNNDFNVIALDISKEMLNALKKKIKNDKRCKLVNSDIDTFLDSNNGLFDVIAFSSVLHHLPDFNHTLKKAFHLLKNNGYVYIAHEPSLRNNKRDMIGTVVFTIDRLVSPLWLYHRLTTPKMDYSLSDYHVKQGIDQMAMKKLFTQHGFSIIRFELYNARKNGIISMIDSYITKQGNRTSFRLIARSCPSR